MKAISLKRNAAVPVILALFIISGCKSNREILALDFQKGRTLRYKFVSSRKGWLDWRGSGEKRENRPDEVTQFSESLEAVVAYKPIEVNPLGTSTVKAKCESIKVKRWSDKSRSRGQGRDAAEALEGKSFTLSVRPDGKIKDRSELKALLKKAGDTAFRRTQRSRRVKDPDMLSDFTASQWFLWDSVSSIDDPGKGVEPGQSWKSRLLIPTPFVSKFAREVTYTLEEVREPAEKSRSGKKGEKAKRPGDRIAVIKSESHFYSIKELNKILAEQAERLNLQAREGALRKIAGHANGRPEAAKQILKRITKNPEVKDSGTLTPTNVNNALKTMDVDVPSFSEAPGSWPLPYEGSFNLSGRFGMLCNYRLKSLHGEGKQLFNLDKGRIERYNRSYKVEFMSSLLFPLPGTSPLISYEQKLSMRLLK